MHRSNERTGGLPAGQGKETRLKHLLVVTTDRNRFGHVASAVEPLKDTIHWAASGHAALDAIAGQTPDLVLVDERLADMHGLDLVSEPGVADRACRGAVVNAIRSSPTQRPQAVDRPFVGAVLPRPWWLWPAYRLLGHAAP